MIYYEVCFADHLGSVDIITDQRGAPTHSMSFDPWGARRVADSNAITAPVKNAGQTDQQVLQNLLAPLGLTGSSNPITTRGYTGHEMVDDMGIIYMTKISGIFLNAGGGPKGEPHG